ncbi:MAG: MATE family efflux transporter [Clostridia bacterium]|nr:MATE family efflux transporter [Clostridia bacterium]
MLQNTPIDVTQGKISRNVWKLALPVIITNLVQVIYNLTDTFWVSKLSNSTEAIAAVAVTFSVIMVLISLGIGLSVATTTLSAQYFGAGKEKEVKKVAYTSLVMLSLLAVIISVTGIAFSVPLLKLLNTPDNVMPYALEYFRIIMFGMLFMFSFFILSGVLRGLGDTYTPMIAGVISAIANVILDPLLIFGIGPFPEMGIAGAAYATVISRAAVSIYLTYLVFSGRMHFKLSLKELSIDFKVLKEIFKIGIPSSVSQVLISLGATLLMGRVNMFGDTAAATFGLGHRLDSFAFIAAAGLSQATVTMVGQNLGAGQKERAKDSSIYSVKATFIILTAIGVLLSFFPQLFFRVFSNDPGVIKLGRYYTRFVSIAYGFIGGRIVLNGAFQGAGAAFTSMILSIVSLWGFRIPLAYILSYTSLGIKGLWLGIGLSFILSFAVMIFIFTRWEWMDKAIVRKKQ